MFPFRQSACRRHETDAAVAASRCAVPCPGPVGAGSGRSHGLAQRAVTSAPYLLAVGRWTPRGRDSR
jgi:hypothetical protein